MTGSMNESAPFATLDANEAVADVAFRLSEVVAIYPITPASAMGEHADEWAAAKRANLWGDVPDVVEMQSEGGAAGALHGALTAGALATSFTASQGLLLMLPNLYKIAGELTPFVLHVAARTVATHALSIFGDHSDVMAVRGTGMAMLCANTPQEAQDFAAIAHAATLRARIPFLHFFDGFRTSHEMQRIALLADDTLRALVDAGGIAAHRGRGLSPEHPVLRGSAQNPDTFFQGREAANPFHDACAGIVSEVMQRFGDLTGRAYAPFEYHGHPRAQRVLVMMGSGAECAQEYIDWAQAQGEQLGLLKVRLYRPFSAAHLLAALPASARSIAVLDRCKEPGAAGEPLLQDVVTTLVEAVQRGERATLPRIIGGRYGLAGKEFTPAMVLAVFEALLRIDGMARLSDAKSLPTRFTVGIDDDVTHLSLPLDEHFDAQFDARDPAVTRAVFFGLGADGTVSSNKQSIAILGERGDLHCQGYFVYDSKKSGSTTVSHLRFGPRPIHSTWQIRSANFIAVHDPAFLSRYEVLASAADGATLLLNLPVPAAQAWDALPLAVQNTLVARQCRLFVIDAAAIAEAQGLGRRINTVMQSCFFAISGVLPHDEAVARIKDAVAKTWGKRGPEVVRRNVAAIDATLANLHEVAVPAAHAPAASARDAAVAAAPSDDFVQRVTRKLLDGHGNSLPVSAFPVDGTWPTGTSRHEKRAIAREIPVWEADVCVQCNKCSMICPHAAIVTKVFEPAAAANAPAAFHSLPETHTPELAGLQYVVAVAPDDCTGCGQCVEVCPAKDRTYPKRKAINLRLAQEPVRNAVLKTSVVVPAADAAEQAGAEPTWSSLAREAWAFSSALPPVERARIPQETKRIALLQPLFEFPGACEGCGETPYIRLLTQLFGDRLLIANGTGCSSIYGGNLPATPYRSDAEGRGPAWSNSLFEDNAEFGFGMRLAVDVRLREAQRLLRLLAAQLPAELVRALLQPCDSADESAIAARREQVRELRRSLHALRNGDASSGATADTIASANLLAQFADAFVPTSVWIVGGDGWAYDIGYGGLDHVLASNRKVNILVLDTEVYSNTGGQQSKATPLGAVAKFASAGKETRKKDLGLLAMSHGHVYVASVAMQAKAPQTVTAMLEAERYPGPAIVIAHSPCIAHGYDLVHAPAQQRRAVDSGAWPLFRYDPQRIQAGLPPLQIDADPVSLPMRAYMQEEARFRMVELRDPARYARLVDAAERAVHERHALYEQLAKIRLPADMAAPAADAAATITATVPQTSGSKDHG
jgi:pyruvate-ferredoxin/flavodoxin oxidoreductase